MRILTVLFCAILTIPFVVAQQEQSQDTTPESAKQAASKKDKGRKESTPASVATPNKPAESGKPAETSKPTPAKPPIRTNITMWRKSRR